MPRIHEDFENLLNLAVDIFCGKEKIKPNVDVSMYKVFYFKDVEDSLSYINAQPKQITYQKTKEIIRFDFGNIRDVNDVVYFCIDKKWLTCHFCSNDISGTNYFSVDRGTREVLYMERKLFNMTW